MNVLQRIHHRYNVWRLTRTITPLIEDPEDQVIEQVWASPQADAGEILAWIEEQIAATPRVAGLQWYKISVLHCTPQQYEAFMAGRDESSDADLITQWLGPRTQWWYAGRDQIEQAIPARHDGLCIAIVNIAASVADALGIDEAS